MSAISNQAPPTGRVLTGRMVLAWVLGFFAVVVGANGIMAHFAMQTFRGLASNHAYTDGLAYNNEIKAAHHQDALGWQVKGSLTRMAPGRTRVLFTQANAQGMPAERIEWSLRFEHPVDRARDKLVALSMDKEGAYSGELDIEPGQWSLALAISQNGSTVFQSHNKVEISDRTQ